MKRYHMTEISGFEATENEEEWGKYLRFEEVKKLLTKIYSSITYPCSLSEEEIENIIKGD